MIRESFLWLGRTAVGQWMQSSDWGFALTETVHLVALALLGGTVIVGGLAAGGLLFRDSNPAVVLRGVYRVGLWALAAMVVSGTLLVSSKPLRYFLDNAFRLKLSLLALAFVISTLVVRQVLVARAFQNPLLPRAVAILALLLWLGTGITGRLIGYQ